MKRRLLIAAVSVAFVSTIGLGMIADVQLRYADRILSLGVSPWPPKDGKRYGIVLGASVRADGTPSPALQDRLDTAVRLYNEGFVGKIFLTGDNGEFHVDELNVMKPYMLRQGVKESDVIVDGRGYRTYESCKHAKEQGITPAVIVTNRFHLGRALYLCNRLGVDAVGVSNDRPYSNAALFWLRDIVASVKAFIDVNLIAPKPPVQG